MARRYARDNRGRFTSGGAGATARGGRLRTAAGNKRATQTQQLSGAKPSGTIGKPKGLKPQDSGKLKKGIAYNRMRATNAKIANRPDIAQQHIPGRFRGQAAKRMDASIDRAVKQVQTQQLASLMKPKAQVKAERAARAEANRAAQAAKPKRTKTADSMRMSRAKRVLKEREMKTSGTLKQWEQSKRTQERALAFYKSKAKRK
jgi:hypothetical protein